MTVEGAASGAIDLEGIVQSVDPTLHTIALSADDLRHSGRDVELAVPPAMNIAKFAEQQVISARVEIRRTRAPTGWSQHPGTAGARG